MNKITWKIGGEAGFGIMISGMTFSKVLTRAGYHIIEVNDYPSLIRGGHNVVAVTISDEPIHAPYRPVDILVALNKQTIDFHLNELSENAAVIYDGEQVSNDSSNLLPSIYFYSVPLLKIAKDVGGGMLMRNTVALGASLALLGLDINLLTDILRSQFVKKGEAVVAQNVNAAKSGFEHIQKNYPNSKINFFPAKEIKERMVITGAESIGLGAITGGLKFFAAYPMTPINGLLAYMAAIQDKVGLIYKQPEDEISGINMAIGASFAGVRSMVATSGGGFSLMVEGVGLAAMTETPVVIVMGMRPGPSTGLPTWTSQGDLHFILNASQGEFPRLVLAPADAQEAFYLTQEALNLADRYQTPTFILVDKTLMESRFTHDIFNLEKVPLDRGKLLSVEVQNKTKELPRYQLTEDGISPRPIPGRIGGVFRANSDEHNEMGYSEESAENTQKMMEKRLNKQKVADTQVPEPKVFGQIDADITLVGWGTTKGAVLEAIKQFSIINSQFSINYLHLNYINPFPTNAVERILKSAKKVIDIEGNHNGQMADLIRMKTGIEIKDRILKYDGRPFYPEDIIAGIKKYV